MYILYIFIDLSMSASLRMVFKIVLMKHQQKIDIGV